MKDYPIKGFGSKLMVSSRSVNNIPDQYLAYSQNARIYDGGIGPRMGKQLIVNSSIGTNNKGGFLMGSTLYQITNSKIYSVNTTTGVQTEKATIGYDVLEDVLVYGSDKAIIVASGQTPKIFNGTTITDITNVPSGTTGIIEYCRGFSFITKNNVLYISRPITSANPEYAYDWTGAGSQNITYDTNIIALKGTMNGLYVFLDNKVEFLGANALQNVSGSATFISTPLGEGSAPISNQCVTSAGDKIFYLSKNLQIQTVNYVEGTTNSTIGELSAQPVIGVREMLTKISTVQPSAFAYYNENNKLINFHVRSVGSGFNDYCVTYDLINNTWNIDTGKNFNLVVKSGFDYYGFSDINSCIYKEDSLFSDNGTYIDFKILSNQFNIGSILHKLYGGFFTSGAIGIFTSLRYRILIDNEEIFEDSITAYDSEYQIKYILDENNNFILSEDNMALVDESTGIVTSGVLIDGTGDISGTSLSGSPVSGLPYYESERFTFDRVCDEGRIYQSGKRIQIEITSQSQIQDFIIDMLGVRYDPTSYTDQSDKF